MRRGLGPGGRFRCAVRDTERELGEVASESGRVDADGRECGDEEVSKRAVIVTYDGKRLRHFHATAQRRPDDKGSDVVVVRHDAVGILTQPIVERRNGSEVIDLSVAEPGHIRTSLRRCPCEIATLSNEIGQAGIGRSGERDPGSATAHEVLDLQPWSVGEPQPVGTLEELEGADRLGFADGPRLQVEHLVSRGRTRIAFAGPADPRLTDLVAERRDLARATAEARPDVSWLGHRQIDDLTAVAALDDWLSQDADGIVAYNDDVAALVVGTALRRGMEVPKRLPS